MAGGGGRALYQAITGTTPLAMITASVAPSRKGPNASCDFLVARPVAISPAPATAASANAPNIPAATAGAPTQPRQEATEPAGVTPAPAAPRRARAAATRQARR